MQHERRKTSRNSEPDALVMQAQIEMLFDAFGDIKVVMKSVEETIGLIKVFDVQIKQIGIDLGKQEEIVRKIVAKVDDIEDRYRNRIEDAKTEFAGDFNERLDKVSTTASETKSLLQSKLSFVSGAVAAVTLLGGLLYGVSVWIASGYIEKTDNHDRYIHTAKTLGLEEHLREVMTRPPKLQLLNPEPVVVPHHDPPQPPARM